MKAGSLLQLTIYAEGTVLLDKDVRAAGDQIDKILYECTMFLRLVFIVNTTTQKRLSVGMIMFIEKS